MRKYALSCIILSLTGLILVSCSTGSTEMLDKSTSAVTWGQSWNNNCASCNFTDNTGATATTTLGQMYLGSDFTADIAKLNLSMSAELGYDAGLGGASALDPYYVYIPGEEIEPE